MRLNKIAVIWITGLSGSGKTTISKILKKKLIIAGKKVIHLDGDELRSAAKTIINKNSYSRKSREEIGLFYSKLANYLSLQNLIVIVSVMALEKKVHLWNKKNIKNYYDVFLDVPIHELKRRDPKDIYKNNLKKKIKHLYGIDLKFSKPKNPFLHIKWKKKMTKISILNQILKKFKINDIERLN